MSKSNCFEWQKHRKWAKNKSKSKTCLTGHSQLWDRADLNTMFARLKSVYLNPKSKVRVGYIKKSASVLMFHSILDRLQKTSFWANFNSSYDIILSYLVKNSIQNNKDYE